MAITRTGPAQPVQGRSEQGQTHDQAKRKHKRDDEKKGHTGPDYELTLIDEARAELTRQQGTPAEAETADDEDAAETYRDSR